MKNLKSYESLAIYSRMIVNGEFPCIDKQKYKDYSNYSSEWNNFVFHESARVAEQLGYGYQPISFINDILYNI